MATLYPGALDVFTNPNPTDTLNSVTVPHAKQHTDVNDAIEAIESVLGINPAGTFLTVKDRVVAIENVIAGLGSMSTQNSNNVSITGGSIDNITINGGTF